jgi:hypothetical protein
MDAASHDEALGSLMNLQGAWDRRKTKQNKEERSLHEVSHTIFKTIKNALSDKI